MYLESQNFFWSNGIQIVLERSRFNSMIILGAAVCVAVVLYWVIQTGVSTVLSKPTVTVRVGRITETPLRMMQCSSTAPRTTASKLITRLKRHLRKTVSTKTEHCNLHEGRICCWAVVLDCIGFSYCECT